ncbi:UDP-glucose 4-epimerase GalE [Litorivivens sp.]|uniref:UDP-glucose 4-epimerase GalE n=3 Tax=Litorivivens sp. TaxID=2020868 RepID=UPI0035694C51
MKRILVTGGTGYIGSHTVVELLQAGCEVTIVDNLSNSFRVVLERIASISGRVPDFIEGDIRDRAVMEAALKHSQAEAVIHFAGLKAVGESVEQPLKYYDNNVNGTLVLCEAMNACGVKKLIFSSSATVYGDAAAPYREDMPLGRATNPYGASKAMIERILEDQCIADGDWSVGALRYFNPIGAHASGLIGEDPQGIPNNLMPFISKVAVGQLPQLSIFGDDYDTPDGTCIRDYLHVGDLADGHAKALKALATPGYHVFNLGTGRGYSVKEMVETFQRVTGQAVPHVYAPRREGDLAEVWADASKAKRELGWSADTPLEKMMEDTWRWQSGNPNGYRG